LYDFDQSSLQSWDLHTVFDTADETDRVDLGADVLEKRSDEGYDQDNQSNMLTWPRFGVLQQILP